MVFFKFRFQKQLLHNLVGLLKNCNSFYWVSNKINPCASNSEMAESGCLLLGLNVVCECVLDHMGSYPDLSLVSFLMSLMFTQCLLCTHTCLTGSNRVHSALICCWIRCRGSCSGRRVIMEGLHSIDLAAVRATEKKAYVSWETLSGHRESR